MAFDRRSLLIGSATLGGAALVSSCAPSSPSSSTSTSTSASSSAHALAVLVAVADRLLPDDETGPGARAVGVANYLERALADARLAAVRTTMQRGVAWLDQQARTRGAVDFVTLAAQRQDEIIAALVDNKARTDGFGGPQFVRLLMALTLEAHLGDPRHGGNRDGAGWRSLGFSPDGRGAVSLSMPHPAPTPPGLKVVP